MSFLTPVDLTELESGLFEALLASGRPADWSAALRTQLKALAGIEREHTVVGFYTRLTVDRTRCLVLPGAPLDEHWHCVDGAHAEATGLKLGLCMLLWSEAGYIDCIEGVTYGDGQTLDPDLFSLKATSMQLT